MNGCACSDAPSNAGACGTAMRSDANPPAEPDETTLQADAATPQCGDIRLCATWLAASGAHKIEVMDAQ